MDKKRMVLTLLFIDNNNEFYITSKYNKKIFELNKNNFIKCHDIYKLTNISNIKDFILNLDEKIITYQDNKWFNDIKDNFEYDPKIYQIYLNNELISYSNINKFIKILNFYKNQNTYRTTG